jgi:hypothetical protein
MQRRSIITHNCVFMVAMSSILIALMLLQFVLLFKSNKEDIHTLTSKQITTSTPIPTMSILKIKRVFPMHLATYKSQKCDELKDFDSAIITLHGRIKERLMTYIPTWQRLTWIIGKYPVIIFYDSNNTWVNPVFIEEFQSKAPSICTIFIPVNQTHPNGYIWCSIFLSIEMYKHPAIEYLDYLLRMDDDVAVDEFAFVDIFEDMKKNNISVGWKQNLCDNKHSLDTSYHLNAYKWYQNKVNESVMNITDSFNLVWRTSIPKNTDGRSLEMWRQFGPQLYFRSTLIAGVVEMYRIDIFRSELYQEYAQFMKPGLENVAFTEQITKTMWMEMLLPLSAFKSYACALSVYHKDTSKIEHWFLHSHCDYGRARLKNINDRKHCNIDPEMRIC